MPGSVPRPPAGYPGLPPPLLTGSLAPQVVFAERSLANADGCPQRRPLSACVMLMAVDEPESTQVRIVVWQRFVCDRGA